MTRSRLLFFLVSSLVVLLVVGGSLVGSVRGDEGEDDSLYKYLSVFTEVVGLVRQAYVEDVEPETLMAGALDATTEALDPFSAYFSTEERLRTYMDDHEDVRRLTGLSVLKYRGSAFVAAIAPGAPAAEVGLEVGDVISAVAGSSARKMPLWEIYRALDHEPGETASLEIIRGPFAEELTVELTYRAFEAPEAYLEPVRDQAAWMLHLGAFEPASFGQVRNALSEAASRGLDRMLVDLRGVAGGDAETAYRVAGLLVSGELGGLEHRGELLEQFTSGEPALWQGKLVVLVNRGTLGPAEILAQVLRQSADAELVGEPTFGYAGRRSTLELASGARLLYTDAFYTGPDGEPLDDGLDPDVRVRESSQTFEERDLSMDELILERGIRRLLGEEEAEAVELAA